MAPVVVGGGRQDRHERQAGPQQDPATDIQETTKRANIISFHLILSQLISTFYLPGYSVRPRGPARVLAAVAVRARLLARAARHHAPLLAGARVVVPVHVPLLLARGLRLHRDMNIIIPQIHKAVYRTAEQVTSVWRAWKGLKCAARAATPAPDKLARISALFCTTV